MLHSRKLVLVIIIICIIALGSWGGIVLTNKTHGVHIQALAERAEVKLEALAKELSLGKTLHMNMQVYRRHGPAASRIQEDPWALPETRYEDIWMEVDTEGSFYCFQAITTDTTGNVVQEAKTVDGEVIYRHVGSEKERWTAWKPWSVARYLQDMASWPDRLLERGWQSAGSGQWDGRETAIFERRSNWVNPNVDLSRGYVIPWTADLNPRETVFRFEIVVDYPLINSEQTWVVDASGERTMVEERKVVVVEVLDEPPPLGPCPPAPPVKEFTLADAPEVLDLSSLLPSRFEHIDADSEGLSNRDLGLGPDFSKVVLFRSDEPHELVYAYLTIVDRNIDVETEFKIADGLKAGIPGAFKPFPSGTDIAQQAVWAAVRQEGGGGGGISSDEGWDLEIIRIDRIIVALYRVSESPDKEPLYPLAEQIERRTSKFSQ
jgi:hypothetical protein